MKICMIGLGSIGKRHVKNIIQVLNDRKIIYEIDALRNSRTALPDQFEEFIHKQYYSVENLPDDYDVIFITNPTLYHYETIKNVLTKTKHMFIEKPVFDALDYDWASLPFKDDGVYYVACPLRHKEIMEYVKRQILPRGHIISARIISTSYLPLWRKDVDYRDTYSSRMDMGGGVTKDLIHEWDYALYLFGNPQKVFHIQKHLSALEIDSDDISVYIAEYSDMVLEIHLDYIGHKTERIIQLFTDKKRIDIDLITNEIYEYVHNELVKKQQFEEEDFYKKEMEYFFDCVEKRESNINTIANACNTLKIALMGE